MKRVAKSAKAVIVANKVLDILDVVITPIHTKALDALEVSKSEVSEVFTVAKLLKDIAALTENDDSDLENLSDEEIRAQLEAYRAEQEDESDDEEGSDE